jgi:cytochrome P450 family 6
VTFDHRENNQETRKDFMQLLMQLRNTGKVGEDGDWNAGHGSVNKTLTIEQCAAQVFIFFVAGFETSASTSSFCLYELAKNPHLMEKLVAEIDRELEKSNGEVTYDSIKEMTFLEECISGEFMIMITDRDY